MRSFRGVGLVLAAAATLILAGCSTTTETSVCPTAQVLKDTDRLTRFSQRGRDVTDILFRARISDLRVACQRDGNQLQVGLVVQVEAERGPANTAGAAPVSYFVAISDTSRNVLTRERFGLEMPFDNGPKVAMFDELAPVIPLPEGRDGNDYAIFVGFELNRAELDYNRRNR